MAIGHGSETNVPRSWRVNATDGIEWTQIRLENFEISSLSSDSRWPNGAEGVTRELVSPLAIPPGGITTMLQPSKSLIQYQIYSWET
jgi:hypothetical protein